MLTIERLPHEGVAVRLAPSPIHGIGVFAQQPIAAGTNVFANDEREILWVESDRLAQLPLEPWQRAFYHDFALRRGSTLGCPASFDQLTVGWYCNEPTEGQEANLTPSSDFDLIAARDIAAGEELTVRYAAFDSGFGEQSC